jgi:hypothetical protein
MIDLGPGGDLFRAAGWAIWLIVIGVLFAAYKLPKTGKGKAIALVVVIGLLVLFPGRRAWELKQQGNASDNRLAKAEALFQERCKKSGEFIHKTAENVEGILLIKVRPKEDNFGEQFKMDDPYGNDWGNGEAHIKLFLHGRNEKGFIDSKAAGGYRYVDAIDPVDGKRYRYTGGMKEVAHTSSILMGGDGKTTFKTLDFVLDKASTSAPSPRYGVTYDDISTHEDREYWIAGSSLKVIDLQTNEVMAERIGYMMDPGQGALAQGGTHPAWDRAKGHACPASPGADKTRNFVEKAIKPIQEK